MAAPKTVSDHFEAIRRFADNPYTTSDIAFIEYQRLKYERQETGNAYDRNSVVQNCLILLQEALEGDVIPSRKIVELACAQLHDYYIGQLNDAFALCRDLGHECREMEKVANRTLVTASGRSESVGLNFVQAAGELKYLADSPHHAAAARCIASAVSAGELITSAKREIDMLYAAASGFDDWCGSEDYERTMDAYERVRKALSPQTATVSRGYTV